MKTFKQWEEEKKSKNQTIIKVMALIIYTLAIGYVVKNYTLAEDYSIVTSDYYENKKITMLVNDLKDASAECVNQNILSHNDGYRKGMLYAYDMVVVCGASPEQEGLRLGKSMGRETFIIDNYELQTSSIICEE